MEPGAPARALAALLVTSLSTFHTLTDTGRRRPWPGTTWVSLWPEGLPGVHGGGHGSPTLLPAAQSTLRLAMPYQSGPTPAAEGVALPCTASLCGRERALPRLSVSW